MINNAVLVCISSKNLNKEKKVGERARNLAHGRRHFLSLLPLLTGIDKPKNTNTCSLMIVFSDELQSSKNEILMKSLPHREKTSNDFYQTSFENYT